MNIRANLEISLLIVSILFFNSLCAAQNSQSSSPREFYFGAAVAMDPFYNEPIYKQTLRSEFNMIVAENAFKFDAVHPSRNTYNFANTDALVNFAQANNMKIRGHTLVWYNQIPTWLTSGNFTRDEVIQIMREHIQTLVGRYRGQIIAWDVVNEAIDDAGNYRTDSFWYQKIGPEYIKMAFEFARQADPNAKLYYNDYSIERLNNKSNKVYEVLRDLKNQGTPIDGIGWQMHIINGSRAIMPSHERNARRFNSLGLELSITEMDVRINLPTTTEKLQQQAGAYRLVTNFCYRNPNCKALVLWGFTDKYSWIPSTFPGQGDALIFDTNYQPKPAYFAVRDSLPISWTTSNNSLFKIN